MSSLCACSVQGFYVSGKALHPHLLMPKINQFHLLVVLFLVFFPASLSGQFPQSHMAAEKRKAMSCIFRSKQKGLWQSERSMNAWDTVMYRRAFFQPCQWVLKARLMELPPLNREILSDFLVHVIRFIHSPTFTTSLP